MIDFAGNRGLSLNGMKKILGVVVGVSFLSAMGGTAFAADLLNTALTGSTDTVNTTTSSPDIKTTDTSVSATPTTSTSNTDSGLVPPATPITRIAPPQAVLPALSAHLSLDGEGAGTTGVRNISITTSRAATSVEVLLVHEGDSENAPEFHLGQAMFDAEHKRWVLAWDSTSTQDGAYRIFAKVTLVEGAVARSNKAGILIRNHKEAPRAEGVGTVPATPTLAERVIEDARKANERKIEAARKELSQQVKTYAAQRGGIRPVPSERTNQKGGIPIPPKPATVDYEKVINDKSQELKDALDKGDIKKREEIIANIARIAGGAPEGAPVATSTELHKKVEEGVAKLEQAMTESSRGIVDEKTFKVEAVQVAEVQTKPDGTQTASKIAFRGKGLPDSFVTLYIYSIPIVVTVKTDSDGNWNYTLDKELDNGNHQVYVGLTDVKGQVVVKSNPLPFVKTASAITVEQALAIPEAQAAPSIAEGNYFYGIIAVIVLIIAIALIIIGFRVSRNPNI